MSFFPLANISKIKGYCTLHNFSSNNWEPINNSKKTIWAIYSNGTKWITKKMDSIEYGESITYYYDDIFKKSKNDDFPLILLQFRKTPLKRELNELPNHEFKYNKVPEWRATVGFSLNNTKSSYQGEINPFPPNASLLTFHPFIQHGRVKNFFLFLNLERMPFFREVDIEIYEANTNKFIDKVKVKSNSVNLIPLDKYNFSSKQLPIFICRSMAGIPFGLGVSNNHDMLSLEHTHPPASFTVHGERFKVQNEIKRKWFNILKPLK